MDGVVHLPVPAPGQPLDVVVARGHVDGCGAVVGGEPVAGGEAAHVADVTEHGRGDDRADAVDVGDAGLGCGDDAGDPVLRRPALLGDGAQLVEQFVGQLETSGVSGAERSDVGQSLICLSGSDFLAEPAGHQFAEHRVQPARDPIVRAAQIAVSASPDLDHRGLILDGDCSDIGRTQRGDRHRTGVVRIVLVRLAGVEQTHPRSELGLHVQDAFTGGEQLLSKQMPQTAGTLDRPTAIGPASSPLQQPVDLTDRRPHPELAELRLARIQRERRV